MAISAKAESVIRTALADRDAASILINRLNKAAVTEGVGVKAGTGVTVVESGDAILHKTVLTLTNLAVAMVDATTNGSQGTQKVYDFPEGNIHVLGAVTNLTTARVGTALTATSAIVGALGTVAAGVDATLTSTEANIVPSTAGTLTAGAGTMNGCSTGSATFDGTTTPVDAILNFATPDAGSTGNDTLTVNGTITLHWVNLGDHP